MRRSRLACTAMKTRPTREPKELAEARVVVRERSGGLCEIGAKGCTGRASQMCHRKHRRHGDHRPVNLLDGCSACHDYCHAHPWESYLAGWFVWSHDDPELVEVVGRSATRERSELQDPDSPGVVYERGAA